MRISVVPQTLYERVALACGIIPTPLLETFVALLLAKTVIAGAASGVFDALEPGALPAAEIAKRCGTDSEATERLLRALCACGYLSWRRGGYALSRVSRRWLLRTSLRSLRPAILHRNLDLRFMCFEDYVRRGTSRDFHGALDPDDWELYHQGQASHAALIVGEVVNRAPLPKGASDLLDLGGGHGLYAFTFCSKYPNLRAQVVDLDITFATSMCSERGQLSQSRVRFTAGDLRDIQLPEASCDAVLMANVLHHLDGRTIQRTFGQIAKALRARGVLIVLDAVRPSSVAESGQLEALLDLYFAAAGGAGLWTIDQIRGFQKEAGLIPLAPVAIHRAPFMKMQAARRQ